MRGINSDLQRLSKTDLSNWRQSPYSAWSFQNVRELIPTATINAAQTRVPASIELSDAITRIDYSGLGVETIESHLKQCHTDAMLVRKSGRKIWQWQAAHCEVAKPHIVFSISKSITAMMAGILVGENLIDTSKFISYYLPGVNGSAYEDCTVQQVLDMTVALDFEEAYLDASGDYRRYRNATCWNPVDQNNAGPALEDFLYSIGKLNEDHGQIFRYRSPNSDLLGLLIERVANIPYAQLLSELIWQPMGAETDGYVTVDRNSLARGAGGICVTVDDLARFGQLVLDKGVHNDVQIIPQSWIHDTLNSGNRQAWLAGDFSYILPKGRYHNKWYQIGDPDQCYMALGIHGQWLFINPTTSVVIAKLSSQPEPVDDALDIQWLNILLKISQQV